MAKYDLVRKVFRVIADDSTIRKATAIVSPTHTLKITRQSPVDKRAKAETYILTVGRPNYAERQFIKDCRAANEPFPVKKVLVQRWPVKR